MHFYCFQHHQHHISILLSPPPLSPKQPQFSSFPSTNATLLLFSHHHNISIVFSSPPLPPPHFYCFTSHFMTSYVQVQSLTVQSCLNLPEWCLNIVHKKQWKYNVGFGGGVKTMEMRWWCWWWWRKQLQCDVCGGGFDVKTIEMWCCCSKEHALCWTADLLNVCTGAYPCLSKLSVSLKLRGVCVWLGVMLLHRYRAINWYAFGVGRLNSRGVWLF